MDGNGPSAGRRVRALRAEQGLSLTALAEAAGIGKATLSELETGRRNPTLDTLYALAGPLGVPLAELVEDRDGVEVADDALQTRRLHVMREEERTTEVYLVRLVPGGERSSPAHPAGTTERLVVLAGSLTVTAGEGSAALTHEVATGGTITWAADQPHTYRCTSVEVAAAVDVIVTPTAGATPSN